MRIAVGGLGHESNTFNPELTCLDAFRVLRGEELLREEPARTLRSMGIDVIPTVCNIPFASGVVDRDAYYRLRDELLRGLEEADELDGVCLTLHGAMVAEEVGCAETDLLRAIRETVSDDVLISASLDLHGNVPEELADYVDILTAYRTAPHTDAIETRIKSATLLVEPIRRDLRPKSVIVRPPILLPGEYVVTTSNPAASVYRLLEEADETRGIMDSSLLVGMAWADVPHAGASAIAVAEDENHEETARQEAYRIARAYWNNRMRFRLEVEAGSPEECIEAAESSDKAPFFISDSGDNVTAGAAGDVPVMAEKLISRGVEDAVVAGILDGHAVEACREAGVGTRLRLVIGGRLDRVNGYPLEIRGRVLNLTGDGAVFRVDGVDIILTARRVSFTSPRVFASYGIDVTRRRIVVVKLGYLFAELRRVAAESMIALTPGFTCLSMDRLEYRNLRRPIFPLDRDFEWSPEIT
jgi:microcystin degradation protein MlrC